MEKWDKAIKIFWIIQRTFLLVGICGVLLLGLEIFVGHMDPDKLTEYAGMAFGIVVSGFFGLGRALLMWKKDKMEEEHSIESR